MTDPIIGGVSVSAVTATSATVMWTTKRECQQLRGLRFDHRVSIETSPIPLWLRATP